MSTDKSGNGTTDIEQVRADIERDREQLVRTVDALGARLDVKSRARDRIQAVRSDATDAIASARSESVRRFAEVRDSATTDQGRPTQQAIAVAAATALVVVGIVVLARAPEPAPMTASTTEPESPTDLKKPSWLYVAKKTLREFSKDQCTDLAAALTYYAVLALFPAVIALISLVGLVGQGPQTVKTLLGILDDIGASSMTKTLKDPLMALASAKQAAGIAFVVGLASALWSASGYVGSFGRAMNRMYEISEGRPVWKLRPQQLLITLVALVLVALVALSLVLTGPAATAVGNAIGVGSTAVLVWDIAKWPILLAVVVLIVAVLYYATPNVKQPKFRWISIGAIVAILIWIVASAAFGFYVSGFSSYNKTYGSLAGVVVFLLWLWITNVALLFGAELDAELERGRELQAGIRAEKTVQLPPRDTRNIEKAEEKERDDVERGRALRLSGGRTDDPEGEQDER